MFKVAALNFNPVLLGRAVVAQWLSTVVEHTPRYKEVVGSFLARSYAYISNFPLYGVPLRASPGSISNVKKPETHLLKMEPLLYCLG